MTLGACAQAGQICAALMAHQDVADRDVLTELLDIISGDGGWDTRFCSHSYQWSEGAGKHREG
ncbi:hypothetical protein [Burkholderia ambifaria]|uniref:hypothetical protein n=1 Tax=Burkholderia ambifaria TaxID=152480 RepID=UPI0002FF3DAF